VPHPTATTSIMAPKRRKGPNITKGKPTIQDSRVLGWEAGRPKRVRKAPDRYGFPMATQTPPRNSKRKRTSEPQLPRITQLQGEDGQDESTSRSRSKSPSRGTDITDVGDLGTFIPPIYFKSTWEFEAAVHGGDTAISEELKTLILTTNILRTGTHIGVIPLGLKVEFAFTHDHAILQLTGDSGALWARRTLQKLSFKKFHR
jgi:hypothetical protein